VADVEQELIASLNHLPHPANHPVESIRQRTKFVPRPDGQLNIQLSAAQSFDSLAQPTNWAQEKLQHGVSA